MRSEEQSGDGPGAVALPPDLAAAAGAPHIAQVNVSRNSRMHIGPQFVSVTQTVHQDRVVKGRLFGLWLETRGGGAAGTGDARRLRCSVAVFVCWAMAVAVALAVYVGRRALASSPHRIDLDINETWYLRRGDWQAMPEYGATFLLEPARFALVGHTATKPCAERYECTERALEIQRLHQRNGWDDIGPNYLVGGAGDEGLVLEGRGAGLIGAMVKSWNARSVSLMWIGDYRLGHDAPTPAQLRHVRVLLAALVAADALHPQYTLLGHCQVVPSVYSPGVRLLQHLHELDHWDSRNVTGCLQWRDRDATGAFSDDATGVPADVGSTTPANDGVLTPTDVESTSLADGFSGTISETIINQ